MEFTDLNIHEAYETGTDDLVMGFYVPMLANAKRYDRIAGFFSSTSLALAARGIAGLIANNGTMRIVASPRLSSEDVAMINGSVEDPNSLIAECLLKGIDGKDITDQFCRDHVAALGWMLANGRLEMQIAVVTDHTGRLITDQYLVHQKVGIFYDKEFNALSFSGSNNETASGWLGNVEEFKTFKSWEPSQLPYLQSDQRKFDAFWSHQRKGVRVEQLPEAVAEKLIEIGKDFDIERIAIQKYFDHINSEGKKRNQLRLFYYQEDAVEKWIGNGENLLLEMATGTGKTRTAIGCMRHALKNQDKQLLTVIACPQSTLTMQWKYDIESLDLGVEIDATQICDGTQHGWKRELKTKCRQLSTGMYDNLLVYTTHQTCSSPDFIDIIHNVKRADKFFIGDEVHGMGAAKTRNGLLDTYNMRLGLSATPSRWFDEKGSALITDYFGNDSYKFTIEQALSTPNPLTNKPFLVNYNYHPCFIPLTDDELEEYKKLSEKITRMNNSKDKEEFADILEFLLFQRADIEKEAENKYAELERILDEMQKECDDKGERIKDTIIFVSDGQLARVLQILKKKKITTHKFTQAEGAEASSKFGGISEREYLIKQFTKGKYQVLVAIKCLDEGIDIPSAQTGIIMASSTNPREYVQRIGRIIRQAPGKRSATLYDMILHPDLSGFRDETLADFEEKVFRKEMVRVKDLCANALNNTKVLREIYSVLDDLRN